MTAAWTLLSAAVEGAQEATVPAGPAAHEVPAGGPAGTAEILMHHVLDRPFFGLPSKHLVFFVLAALAVIVIARLAVRTYRGSLPRGLGALVEIIVIFIRDEIAEKNVGHGEGRKFTPLLCSFFFFILVAALLGLLPFSVPGTVIALGVIGARSGTSAA